MKPTDKVQFGIEDTTFEGSVLRTNKKGTKVTVAVTIPVSDVIKCTPRTYKRGTKSAKSITEESKS